MIINKEKRATEKKLKKKDKKKKATQFCKHETPRHIHSTRFDMYSLMVFYLFLVQLLVP